MKKRDDHGDAPPRAPVQLDPKLLDRRLSKPATPPEVRHLCALLKRAVAKREGSPSLPIRYRHRRAAQLFHVKPRRAEVPTPLVRSDALLASAWWHEEPVLRDLELAANIAPDRDDGSRLVRSTRHPVPLLDGRIVTQVREVRYAPSGSRFKEFYAEGPGQERTSFDAIPHALLPLYGVDRPEVSKAERVVVCEGIPAAEALLARGVPAVGTLTGALRTPSARALAPLVRGDRALLLWPDNDDVGVQHMKRIAARLLRLGAQEVRLVRWQGGPRKADAADFSGDDGELEALLEGAVPWTPEGRLHRGVMAVVPPVRAIRLSLSSDERPPAPRIAGAPPAAPAPAARAARDPSSLEGEP